MINILNNFDTEILFYKQRMKKQNYKLFILLVLFLLKLNYSSAQTEQDQVYKFTQVLDLINKHYVDSVKNSELVKSAIIASLKELDPHSVYFDKEELEELNRGLKGSFVGIGITYDIINDTVLVLSVIENGPSENAGILAGDRIIKVENKLIAGTGIDDDKLKELLTGKKKTNVSVFIKRYEQAELEKITITRDKIPVNSIDAAYNVSDKITYIKLNRFSATSIHEFKKATKKLSFSNSKKLILDLRNNTGGYLYVSVRLLENFLKKNTPVLFTKGVHNPKKEYKTQINGKFRNSNLIILINEASASASEIVSGAIQDIDRGIIVGRRSYGKGLVQKPYYLVDGSMIRLTIAKYYTPSGRNIQKPYDKGYEKYNDDLTNRLEKGEMMFKDSIKQNDSLKYYTLNSKRLIYGGGGIMPDVFVKLDTSEYPQFYKEHLQSRKINEFIHLYVASHRKFFKTAFLNFNEYKNNYKIDLHFTEKLISYLYKNNIKEDIIIDKAKILNNNSSVNLHLKALIAYDFFGENEYYKIINQKDKAILKAIEILNNKKEYSDILEGNIEFTPKSIKKK